ncbi:aspartate aminotransferase family protein [Virgibacillus sp. W0181]|uniref:aspartate aminotransferase family protein n=1 Tax=Virgibacillus sp. W0181 TaxID=3391581 RepID=UPI003F483B34
MENKKSLYERAQQVLPPVANRATTLGIVEANGTTVTDENGKKYLDFASGVGVMNVGHNHPEVVKAARDQMESMIHIGHNVAYYPSYLELAEKLNELIGGDHMVYFSNSGAEANEGALKLAKKVTKRPGIISFRRGFHGRTLGTASITFSNSNYRKDYDPLFAGVYSCDFPYPYESPLSEEDEVNRCIQQLNDVFKYEAPADQIAAVIVEPIQGEGGYIVPPKSFLEKLRAICDQHGILLIFDEIQTGFGRTGKMFAHEHFDVKPDIITLAKGIASGFPLSAVIAKRNIMEKWDAGTHGGTYGGNPIACAASLAAISILEETGLENAQNMGEYFVSELKEITKPFNIVGEVRGLGLMIALELKDKTGESLASLRSYCLEQGLILLPCGIDRNIIRFIPPTTVTKEEIDVALKIVKEGLMHIEKEVS